MKALDVRTWLRLIFWLWVQQVLRDAAASEDQPEKTNSAVHDANLMFEFLLAGVEMDQDNNMVLLDLEMASMRAGRSFLARVNDDIPRSPGSVAQMVDELDVWQRRPLGREQFEVLVLSMVYAAQRAGRPGREREAWGGALLQLANVTVRQLRGNYLYSYA